MAYTYTRVGVIFLRGGDGATDGEKLVGAEEWKQWSKKKAGKEEIEGEEGKSWIEQETPEAESAAGVGAAWTELPPGESSGAQGGALVAGAGAGCMPGARLVPTDRDTRLCAKRASD